MRDILSYRNCLYNKNNHLRSTQTCAMKNIAVFFISGYIQSFCWGHVDMCTVGTSALHPFTFDAEFKTSYSIQLRTKVSVVHHLWEGFSIHTLFTDATCPKKRVFSGNPCDSLSPLTSIGHVFCLELCEKRIRTLGPFHRIWEHLNAEEFHDPKSSSWLVRKPLILNSLDVYKCSEVEWT